MEEEARLLDEHLALAALLRAKGVGGATALKFREAFGSWRAALTASADAYLAQKLGKLAGGVAKARREAPAFEEQLRMACDKKAIRMIAYGDADYPPYLAEIFAPPLLLYVRGTLVPDAERIAMVGSRRFSKYGEGVAQAFGEALARGGFTVVSGAARGIDSASHRGALKAGRTEAVLGCGVDVVYPPENGKLLAEIAERGAVISEYPPGTPPLPAYFPLRNRIISGLSRGTIVVEAAERSGSLITAEQALQEGRDVFAVPGSIYSTTSQGCHRLIQQGAKLVTSAADVLVEYGIEPQAKPKKKLPAMSKEEREVYQVLSNDHPLSADEILISLKKDDASSLSFLLLQMELKGLVEETSAHGYVRVTPT